MTISVDVIYPQDLKDVRNLSGAGKKEYTEYAVKYFNTLSLRTRCDFILEIKKSDLDKV